MRVETHDDDVGGEDGPVTAICCADGFILRRGPMVRFRRGASASRLLGEMWRDPAARAVLMERVGADYKQFSNDITHLRQALAPFGVCIDRALTESMGVTPPMTFSGAELRLRIGRGMIEDVLAQPFDEDDDGVEMAAIVAANERHVRDVAEAMGGRTYPPAGPKDVARWAHVAAVADRRAKFPRLTDGRSLIGSSADLCARA